MKRIKTFSKTLHLYSYVFERDRVFTLVSWFYYWCWPFLFWKYFSVTLVFICLIRLLLLLLPFLLPRLIHFLFSVCSVIRHWNDRTALQTIFKLFARKFVGLRIFCLRTSHYHIPWLTNCWMMNRKRFSTNICCWDS